MEPLRGSEPFSRFISKNRHSRFGNECKNIKENESIYGVGHGLPTHSYTDGTYIDV